MVRYDQCVESLYDRALVDDRTKALQIIKVMKGAISMSKSRTGECIFRTNKAVKKDLDRLVKIEVRNNNYNMSRIDTNKKFVVDRWTRMLENHTSCSPQTLFEEVLGLVKPGTRPPSEKEKEDDPKLKSLIDLRLDSFHPQYTTEGYTPRSKSRTHNALHVADDTHVNQNGGNEEQFVTERKEIREKYVSKLTSELSNDFAQRNDGPAVSKSCSLQLPPVSNFRREMTYIPKVTSSSEEEESRPLFERDLTDWGNWSLKDKGWIEKYIHREKTKHEDLIIRNALSKIEQEMSGANMIKRHQLRQKLHNDQSQREIEERNKARAKKEREKARQLLRQVSEKELTSTSISSLKSSDTPRKKKHVEFCEPEVEEKPVVGVRKRHPEKSSSFHVSLPQIPEAVSPRKRTTSMT